MRLSELREGERAQILDVKIKGTLKRRLQEMGILPGEILQVEKIAPLGDPIEVFVKGYHLSLRKSEAELVEVEVLK